MSTCVISGNLPEHPVVCKTTGYVFEKRLILKHLETLKFCPITNQPMTKDDLIDIQQVNPITAPRPPSATSFPQLLNMMQNEYDAMILETFHLKQQLEQCKKDLAKQLYQQDASNRVIAKLYKENEELKLTLANYDQRTQAKHGELINEATQRNIAVGSMNDNYVSSATQDSAIIADILTTTLARFGKDNRKAVLAYRKTESSGFLNTTTAYASPVINQEHFISYMGGLNPLIADTTYLINTGVNPQPSASLTLYGEKQFLTFVATTENQVVVVLNDMTSKTTRVLSTIILNANANVTGITTTHIDHTTVNSVFTHNSKTTGDVNHDFATLAVSYTNKTDNTHHIAFYTAPTATIFTTKDAFTNILTITTPLKLKSIVFHQSLRILFALGIDNKIYLYNTSANADSIGNPLLYTISNLVDKNINQLQMHPDAHVLVVACDFGFVGLIALASIPSAIQSGTNLDITWFNEPNNLDCQYVQFSENGFMFAMVSVNKSYTIFDCRKGGSAVLTVALDNVKTVFFDFNAANFFVVTDTNISMYSLKKDQATLHSSIQIPNSIHLINAFLQHQNQCIVGLAENYIVYIEPNNSSAP